MPKTDIVFRLGNEFKIFHYPDTPKGRLSMVSLVRTMCDVRGYKVYRVKKRGGVDK